MGLSCSVRAPPELCDTWVVLSHTVGCAQPLPWKGSSGCLLASCRKARRKGRSTSEHL